MAGHVAGHMSYDQMKRLTYRLSDKEEEPNAWVEDLYLNDYLGKRIILYTSWVDPWRYQKEKAKQGLANNIQNTDQWMANTKMGTFPKSHWIRPVC